MVQLGREARANNVKCFDVGCLLDTVEHAEERIGWMLSWVFETQEDDWDMWIKYFEVAYSRLNGVKTRIIIQEKENGKIGFQVKCSKEPYIESYQEGGYVKKFNYSDFSNIKEFKIIDFDVDKASFFRTTTYFS